MKIYVNTNYSPATLHANTSAKTDAEGVLRVYTSTLSNLVSSFSFKRGTSVPLNIIFPSDVEAVPAVCRFGIKLSGKFDGLLTLAAESSSPETLEDGSACFKMRLNIAADEIDSALKVGTDTADDIAAVAFHAEVEWEDADGNVSASETVPVEIQNNIVRSSSAVSGTNIPGDWTAIMLVEISWNDYLALEEYPSYVRYVIADAPSEVEEHNVNASAHAALFKELKDQAENHAADENAHAALFNDLKDQVDANATSLLGAVLTGCTGITAGATENASHTDNGNFYAFVGSFASIGVEQKEIFPTTISLYRRASNSAVDSSTGRYLRILRKDAEGAWYIAFQSSNALAPLSFNKIGDEMKWVMEEVAGGMIPASEQIAIVQTDRLDATATECVQFGARTTPSYGGGAGTMDWSAGNLTTGYAPAISTRFLYESPLATQADLEESAGTLEERLTAAETALSGKADATALPDMSLYVLKTDYDALVERVAALEAATGAAE